jgi:pilus assembly protein CpaB
MNVSRIAILGVALAAGAAAFYLMMGNSPNMPTVQIVEPAKEEMARVLVATRELQRGERLALEDTNWIVWPKKALQPNFITDDNTAKREELANAVARSLIVAGEPIVEAKVARAGQSGLMAAILGPGMRAVTLRVSDETSAGGFILPGDHVDILQTSGSRSQLLFEDVRVLAVNTVYAENTESANISGSNVTLEMSPDDAKSFTAARGRGNLTLVLRSIFQPDGEIANRPRSPDVTVIRYGRS